MGYSLQSRLSKSQARLKRKLSDNTLKLTGHDYKMLRLDITENKYGDETITYDGFNYIIGHIEFPNNQVPIFTTEGYTAGLTVYDILPIKAYFRFSDSIKKGDIIMLKYLLDPDSIEYKLLIFKIAEHIGSFSNTLLSQVFNVAPYNLDIDGYPDIKSQIENWETEEL